jgi:hypothetical protein
VEHEGDVQDLGQFCHGVATPELGSFNELIPREKNSY